MPSPFVIRLNELFAELGASMGIPGIKFDERNLLSLRIDSKLYLFSAYEATADGYDYKYLMIVRRLLPLPRDNNGKLALLEDIAEKNCFFQKTEGGTIGVRNGALYYTNSVPFEEVGNEPALERYIDRTIRMCDGLMDDFKELGMNAQPVTDNDLAEYMNAYGNVNLMA